MKKLITKFQKELLHLQESLQKESSDILNKLTHLDLKENLDSKRKELEKIIERKYKTFLPTANRFANELRKIAKTAGIDIDKWEKTMVHTADVVKKKVVKNVAKNKAKIAKGKDRLSRTIKAVATVTPKKKVVKKKVAANMSSKAPQRKAKTTKSQNQTEA